MAIRGYSNLAFSNRSEAIFYFDIYNMGMGSIFIEGRTHNDSNKVLINADDCIKPKYYASRPTKEFEYFIKYISDDVELFPRGIEYLYSVLSKLSYSMKNNEDFWNIEPLGITMFRLEEEINCINLMGGEYYGPYAYNSYEMPFSMVRPDSYKLYLNDQPDETKKLLLQVMVLPKPFDLITKLNSNVSECVYFVCNPYYKKTMISDVYLYKDSNLDIEYVKKQYYNIWYKKLCDINITDYELRTNITAQIVKIKRDIDSMIYDAAMDKKKKFGNIFFANYVIDYSCNSNITFEPVSIVFPNKKHKPKRFRSEDDGYYGIFEYGLEKSINDSKINYMAHWNDIK